MGVPTSGSIEMLKLARERKGNGYTSSATITSPIHLSDLSRLTGGNSSGSGVSYPAINQLNPADSKPDGSNPLAISEFRGYEQNVTLTAFDFIFSSTSSNDACLSGFPLGPFYHNDTNNLFPDDLTGVYTAYQNSSGTLVASSGFYQIFQSGGFSSTGKFIQVGSNGAIIGGGNC
tara:strand:- start:1009 stop:1533 length:525 start_codon:yes stop_codon:yes gene_type:complete